MIRHANQLAQKYETSLSAWYRNNDAAVEDELSRQYFRDRFNLNSFTDLLETLIATYDIFGRIY